MNYPSEYLESGVLDEEYHSRLLDGLPRWSSIAGIPQKFVYTSMTDYCSDEVTEWLKTSLGNNSKGGLVMSLDTNVNVETQLMAMTGAYLRNYINAKFISVHSVMTSLKDNSLEEFTVVLIPNFCIDIQDKNSIASWDVGLLLDWMYSRLSKGQKTILGTTNINKILEHYGSAVYEHIQNHYDLM